MLLYDVLKYDLYYSQTFNNSKFLISSIFFNIVPLPSLSNSQYIV